jgi:hypothetical protein
LSFAFPRLPRFARNDNKKGRNGTSFVIASFKNVVAQFIGQMRLMNQATTEIWG